MKKAIQSTLIIVTLCLSICCNKDNDQLEFGGNIEASNIEGIWVNTSNNLDTIIIADTLFVRWDVLADTFAHYYKYFVQYDSIELEYIGLYKLLLPPFQRKIQLNENMDIMIINDFHTVFPAYQGDEFIRVSR